MAGRLKIDLDSVKDEIVQKYDSGQDYTDIATDYGVSGRTLKRRMQAWGVFRPKRLPKRKFKSDLLGSSDVRIFISIC